VRHEPTNSRTRSFAPALLLALAAACLCTTVSCESSRHARPNRLSAGLEDDSQLRQREALDIATRAYEETDPNTSIELYREALAIYRDLYPAWNNLGTLLMQERRYLEAAEAFNAAAGLSPTDARPVYNIGLLYDRSGYLEDAQTYYTRALLRDENYLPALRGLIRADSILHEGDKETLQFIKRALRLEQDDRWREWLQLRKIRIQNLIDQDENER